MRRPADLARLSRPASALLLAGLVGAPLPATAAGWSPFGGLTPGEQCRAAIQRAERDYRLPPHLLAAIGRVESGRRNGLGTVDPWPYSLNVEGTDEVVETKAQAIARVRALREGGVRSIDVGCLQVNLMYHPDAFASLEEAFDPWRNAEYAARFLIQLHDQTGSWSAATAAYHSATPELGGPYAAKVRDALAEEGGAPPDRAAALAFWPRQPPPMAAMARPVLLASASPAAPPPATPAPPGAFGRPALGGFGSLTRRLAAMATGRGLDAYRSDPVRVASALLRR